MRQSRKNIIELLDAEMLLTQNNSEYTNNLKIKKYDVNSHSDFNLFDKIDTKNSRILSNDNNENEDEYDNLDNSLTLITKENNTFETFINDISSLSCWFNSIIYKLKNSSSYVVNSFGLFLGFGSLFICSNNKTKKDLKNFFGFQEPKYLNAGLLTMKENINNSQIIIDNYLICNKNINVNKNILAEIKHLLHSIIIDPRNIENETQKVNNIINKNSGLEDVISSNTLNKSSLSLILVSKINPIWNYKIDTITKNYYKNELTKFINFTNKTFDYFENKDKCVIEIPMIDKSFVIGLINYKNDVQDKFSNFDELSMCINYLKPTIFEIVSIPTIKTRFKTRLNNILLKNGLTQIFDNYDSTFLNTVQNLEDCLQYIDICFGTKCTNKISKNETSSIKKFIINKQFEFYVRSIDYNCVIMMGYL